MNCRSILLMGFFLLVGCAKKNDLPYEAWAIGFNTPARMQVWFERVEIVDVNGRRWADYSPGAVGFPASNGDPTGWPAHPGMSGMRDVHGAALPKEIFVRWQSLVEPKTYEATLQISDEVRQWMLESSDVNADRKTRERSRRYFDMLAIGVAPGGTVRIWVQGAGLNAKSAMCQQATIVTAGPFEGKTRGVYAYTVDQLSPQTKEYLKQHPIPYGSWKC